MEFVVHAAVDGFSRVIPFIQCSDNNRADTELETFYSGVTRFGLPEKIRSDHGGENTKIWRYMLTAHNGDSQCVMTGSSTHNERIERLWRDVHRSLSHFSDIFHELESDCILDLLNKVDVFCLHHIFLPMINRCLLDFQDSWNNHNISTEGCMTPYQLFAEGMNYAAHFDVPTVATMQAISNIPISDEQPVVGVPRISFTPCTTLVNLLQQSARSYVSSDFGKQVYIESISVVGQHLLNGCNDCI